MIRIWFVSCDYLCGLQLLHLDVEGLIPAQSLWDKLSRSGFEMLSSRPHLDAMNV